MLLNYETADINVVSHELVHAEVVHRVGYIRCQFSIPTWFDEGAAMQVDHRPQYSYKGSIEKEFLRIVSLDTPKRFHTNDKAQNFDNYRYAKMAVAEIFSSTDNELYSMLEKVRRGEGGVVVSAANETNKALQRRMLRYDRKLLRENALATASLAEKRAQSRDFAKMVKEVKAIKQKRAKADRS